MRTLVLGLVLGCAGKVTESSPKTDAAVDVVEDAAACNREADELARTMMGNMCTTAVRVSHIDLSILGVASVCGRSTTLIDEATARAAMKPHADFVDPSTFTTFEVGSTSAPWIFFHAPSDLGGVGAIDARTGLVAYYATLSWSTLGTVKIPTSGLIPRASCSNPRPKYHTVGSLPADRSPDSIMDAIAKTPVLAGLGGRAVAGVTLMYVPLDGSIAEPDYKHKNEWVALITSVLLD
jgi:hypothetical protein